MITDNGDEAFSKKKDISGRFLPFAWVKLELNSNSESIYPQDGKMLTLMQGSEVLPWHLVHPSVYDNLMLWYVMSVNSLVVIDHRDRHSLDAVILQ